MAPSVDERREYPVPVASLFADYVICNECDPPPLCSDSVSSVQGVVKYKRTCSHTFCSCAA